MKLLPSLSSFSSENVSREVDRDRKKKRNSFEYEITENVFSFLTKKKDKIPAEKPQWRERYSTAEK